MVNLLPPLTAPKEAALRASIAEVGVITPIAVDQNGEIIDGHNRERIARELGRECPRYVIEVADDDERVTLALMANVDRRAALTKPQRQELIERLQHEYGWSVRRCAAVLEIPKSTAAASGAHDGATGRKKHTGKDEKRYPGKRARPHEVARRADAAAKLWREGYTRNAISEALGVGHGTVTQDVATKGIKLGATREIKRGPAPTIVWRDEPARQKRKPKTKPKQEPIVVDDEPGYRRSTVLDAIETTREALHRDNAENRLAWDAEEAAQAGDEAWFSQARAVLGAAIAQYEGLQRVLDDPAERQRRQDSINELDEMQRPTLRAATP